MRLNNVLFLPSLFVMSGVLAQLSAEPTSSTPDVTYPADDAFVFCSAQDCTGTCAVVDSATGGPADTAHSAPNGMGFQSIYWYDPGHYRWDLYTCITYGCHNEVDILPGTCYNLYDNGVATDFYVWFYYIQGGYGYLFVWLLIQQIAYLHTGQSEEWFEREKKRGWGVELLLLLPLSLISTRYYSSWTF
ncbi:hypothetical protein J3R83DRAFT_1286 [Lanmaoa asiatica]|nr:hypothetical protein J3R83DRAFT_1286 [Lanmaoa asiatica]